MQFAKQKNRYSTNYNERTMLQRGTIGQPSSLDGLPTTHLFDQEIEEMKRFAPVNNVSGVSIKRAAKRISDLVRYAYLSLF